MVEVPQTVGNLTRITGSLTDAIRARQLRVYRAPNLREHMLNASLIETTRGLRLTKEKSSRKIDGAIALALAVDAALMDNYVSLAKAIRF